MDATSTLAASRNGDAARLSITARMGHGERPPRAERCDHHDHGCHRGRGRGEDDATSALKISLKAEVRSTFEALAGGDEAAAPAAEFDAEFKARIRFDGPEGRVDFKLKMELDDVDSATFQSALQGFTETLYAALRSMYGSEPQTPAPSDSAGVTAAALAADPSAGTTAPPATPATTAPAPAAGALPVAESDVAPSPAPQPIATDVADTAVPAPAAGQTAATPAATGSLNLRLRLSYTSFGDSVGPLMQRLAQPGAADDGAAGSLFGELSERFDALTAAGGGNADGKLSLGPFLNALAQRFAPPPASAAVDTPAEESTAEESTAEDTAPEAPAPAPSTFGVFRFTAEYRQVFSYTTPAPQPLALAA